MAIWRFPVTLTDPRAGACVNVWHIRTAGPSDAEGGQFQGAVDALRAFYQAMNGFFPTGVPVKADYGVEVNEGRDRLGTWSTITGIATGNQAPPQQAMCINLKTSIRGRRARGRVFLGPTVVSNIDTDGSITGGTITYANTSLTTLLNASKTDNGWALGVWGLQDSPPKGYWDGGGTGKELPHVFRDVTAFEIKDRWATMRSRLPKT